MCSKCAKFGEGATTTKKVEEPPMVTKRLEKRQRRMRSRDIFEGSSGEALAVDYPNKIRRAREKLGVSQKELASKINEKWSIINKLETGDIRPSDSLVMKLERALSIKLREKVEDVHIKAGDDSPGMTLADLLKEE